MDGNSIVTGPVSKRARKDWDELRIGLPTGPNPTYVVLDWNYGIQLITSGPSQFSQMKFILPKAIEGYERVAVTHAYLNNTTSFTKNTLNAIGIAIRELPGQVMNCNISNTIPSGETSPMLATPTFLLPREAPPNTNNEIWFLEAEDNQYSVSCSGLKFTEFTVTLTDETFFALYQSGSAPTNYRFFSVLRFYNKECGGDSRC